MRKEINVKDVNDILDEETILKLKKAEKQIESGEIVDAKIVFSEMRKKYDY